MPRVLYCIPSMSGGGAERQVTLLSKAMRENGWDVHVALRGGGPNMPRLVDAGATIHRLGVCHDYDPRIVGRIARVIRDIRPDVVQSYLTAMDIAAGRAARRTDTPWILCERSNGPAYPDRFYWIKNHLRLTTARTSASAVIANSQAGCDYWSAQLPRRPCQLIANLVPLTDIDATEAAAPRPPEEKLILYAGRLADEKNLVTLVAALEHVFEHTVARAVLCGEGPRQRAVEREVARRRLGNRVNLVGYVGDLWARMKAADVFVSVSRFEGRPNTVIEAMAAGCPLVVSDIPQHREFLNDRTAILVPPDDPVAMADGILAALTDDAAARDRARDARAGLEQWSPMNVAARYDEVYRGLIEQHASKG